MYYETLWAAIKASTDAIPHGHAINHSELRDAFEPMSYETSQTRNIPLETLVSRNRRSVLHISIYRMHSGRYELTAYAA